MLFSIKKRIITIILISSMSVAYGQSLAPELAVFGTFNSYPIKKVKYASASSNKNEIQFLLSGLFLGYKSFISSQDGSRCAFHLTCSEYALVAIKRQGLIVGSINFFDRFARCNTCTPGLYTRNVQTQRFNDTVR